MPKSFAEWKKGTGKEQPKQEAAPAASSASTGPKSFQEWKAGQSRQVEQTQTGAYNDYLKQLDSKVSSTTSAYEAYKKKLYSLPTFDDPYAGYAVDPVSVENMRTNSGEKPNKAELGRLYKEMTEAKNAAQEARNYQNYTTKLQSFGGDSEKMFQDYADRIKEIESSYRTQPDKWRETRKQVKALEQERDSLKDYEAGLKKSQENAALLDSWAKGHGGTYESYKLAQEEYDYWDRKVTEYQNQLTNVGAAEQDYSGWATDDMTAAAVAGNKAAPRTSSKDVQAKLEMAIRERDKRQTIRQYARDHQADELNKAPDFELKAASGEEKFNAFKQEQAPLRESWEANAGYATDEMSAAAIGDYVPYDPRLYSDYREPDERWSADEKKRFYYLFDNEKTRQQAYDYAIGIDQKYNRSEAEDRDWSTREFATRNFGTGAMASALSVPANLIGGGYDYLRMALENAARGGIYETQYDGMSRWADTTRGAIAEKLNESGTISRDVPVLGGKGLGDLYHLMMSMADSSVAVMAGGGAANAVFFGSAAASTTRDALERGISGNRAVAMGFASGVAEVAGETLSIEHLLKQGDIADYLRHGLLREMAKQGGVEASEEVLTTILNTIADAVINGDESELQQKVYVNVANGMSYADAVRKANKEWLEELGTDALGGFLSGGLMSGGRLALQSGVAAATKYQGDTQGIISMTGVTEEGSKARDLAAQYQQRYDKKGSLTNLQAAKLQAETQADINKADRPKLLQAVQDHLKQDRFSFLDKNEIRTMAEKIVDRVQTGEKEGKWTALEERIYSETATQLAGENVRTGNWLDTSGLKSTQARELATQRLKMVETKGGARAEVKNATMKDGKLQLTIEENGEPKTLSQDELNLDEYQQHALETLTNVLGDDAAAAYNSMTSTGKYGRASSIEEYAVAFGIIRDTFGRSTDTQKAEAAALASPLRKGLTDAQVRYAIAIGQKHMQEGSAVEQGARSARGTGKVTMNGGTLNDGTVLKGVKNVEKVKGSKEYRAIKEFARMLGIDVVLFESEADKNGNLSGAQGAYQDGVIYLDWNAGMNNINDTAERMLLRTMSHELTHFIQQNAAKEYAELKSFVTRYLAETMGENYRELVMEKMNGRNNISYEEALDEVVADACETMLRDSQYVNRLMHEHRSLWDRIRKWIRQFLKRITAQDKGAIAMQGVVNELREIWDLGLQAAVESRTDAETSVAEMSNAKGETVAVTSQETGGMQLSIRTYNEGGKQALQTFLNQQVKKGALTSQEAAEIRSQIETLYQVCKDYDNGKYVPFSAWSNASVVTYDGRPVFSVVKANGEYKLNLDFSLVCKKRRTLDAVFNEMISQGIMDDFDMVQESIAKINDIIRENGFETACGLCFVDSKRYRQGMIADAFVGMYNMQVMSLVKSGAGQKVDYFNYGGDQTKQNTGHGIDTLPDDQLDWTKINKILQAEKKTTVRWKIANYLKNNPSARRRVMRGDFMSTAGFDAVKAKNPELLSLYNSKKGAGGPKAAQSDVQYLNEIISQNKFNEKSAYEVGGVRIQSFSDYVGRLVFDYVQMVADLSAKKLPAHSYTKEFMFAQQFGLTGIKINMSLVPEVIKGGVAAGLDANGNYAWKDGQSFGSTVYDNKGKRLTAAEGFELAKRIQNAEGYSKNCGTIAVGVSDEHIRKMLDDPEIRMIIPYHKSSLNHIVAAMMNIDQYTDYTLQQNTRERKGSKWVNIPKGQEFNFNEALQRLGDAKAAANEYLAWCRENGYKPKFDQFADNANYYKVLEDFSCYDKDGVTNTPLSAVQMKFPGEGDAFGSMSELIEQGLEEDAILQAKQEQAVPEIVKQIQAVLPEFEGTVRERNAKNGSKKAATTGGGTVQLSTRKDALAVNGVDWMDDFSSIKEQLEKHRAEIAEMSPIAEVTYAGEDRKELEALILEQLPKIGGQRMSKNGVSFDYDSEGAHVVVLHARSNELRAAALASPYVLKRGKLIAGQKNHENTNMTTLTFAAPVIINGVRVNVGAVVQFTSNGRPRAVNVETESGGVFKIEETAQGLRSRTGKSQVLQLLTRAVSSDNNIAEESEKSNTPVQLSARNLNGKEAIDAEIDRLQSEIANSFFEEDEMRNNPEYRAAYNQAYRAESYKEKVEGRRALNAVKKKLGFKVFAERRTAAAEEIKRLKDLRKKFLSVTEISESDYEKLKKRFGTTEDWDVAGFILKDGSALDFSGKKQYGRNYAGGREVLHNEVGDVIGMPKDTSPRINMLNNGNIRLAPEIGGINLASMPTAKQFAALRDYIDHNNGAVKVDIDDIGGDTVESFSYFNGTSSSKVISDIRNYFNTGSAPAQTSDLRAFYSLRSGTKTDAELLKGAYQRMLKDKQRAIDNLEQEQQKALEKFNELSERYYEKEREVNAALQELDRLVQHSGGRKAIQAQRAKVSAKEEQMAKALERLTQAKGGSEIQEILRQEREIQMQRTQDRIRDSIDRRDLRQRINKLWKELNARVTNPSEKKRIPVELMQQTLDVLEALNMDTRRVDKETGEVIETKSGEKLRAKLDSLQARYLELQNDPDFRKAAVYDAQVAEYLTNMIAQVGDTPINKMSVAQLETVYSTLQAMVYTANRALKLKLGEQELEAYEVSKAMTKETRSVEKPKTGFLSTWLNAQLSPERMFNRLGGYSKDSYWGKVYGMLNEGQMKQTRLQMEGSLIFEDLMEKENEKNFRKLLDPKNTVDIGLKDENGDPVLITHGMMISLYMHLQNDQNIRHIAYGGLTIPALQDYYNGKKVRGNERATRVGGALQEIAEINDQLHETEDADEIAELEQKRDEAAIRAMDFVEGLREEIDKQLTDYDRQWIAASKELFDGFSKRELNQTTLEVYGIKRANVENYYPIWVDGDFLNTPFETVAKDLSLENAGFMKERVDSSKPIRLADVTDVTSSQIRKVAQYCGLMPAIRGFNKVWGKTQTGYRDSLQKAVHETFGQAGVKYVENLMADLNGARGGQDSALGEFLNRMRGHMAQASLTLSLRVAMGQTASYPTAAAVVGWGPLMKALARGGKGNTIISRADQELIRKWSPLLYYRMKGYSTTELGDIAGMNDKFSRLWKKARWLTGWIQAMDGATVGRLWYAAEYYVQDHNKALVKGTDAYYEAVAKVFNDIVEKTQPDYTAMQRPDILRNPNALVKQLTMFLTQRLQNFNILYDAAATYSKYKADAKAGRNGVTTEDVRQAGIATRRAVISQLAAAATITAFKFLADAILHSMNNYRDDDDKELKAESISREILDMFIDSMAGNVLGGGEIWDIVESKVFGKTYYGIEVSGLATVQDMVDAFSSTFDHVLKAAKDDEYEYGKEQILKDVDKLARNISTVAGIPYANGKKIALGLYHHAQDIRNGAFLSFEAGVERSNAQQASRLYRAYTNGDGAKVKQILEEVPEDKQKDVYSAVRKLIKEQQKSGELNVYEAMRQMKNYGGGTDQVMNDYIRDLYKDGALPKADAIKYLQEYAGKTKEAATKTVTNVDGKQASGVDYNDIDDMFKIGTMNAAEARNALVGYGIAQDTANMKVEYWSYQKQNPGTSMTTEDRFETYWKNYKSIGMTPKVYDDFYVRWNAVQGTDKNHDGKADANSKKEERIAIINSLPLSAEQKDALFNMNWKTGLEKTPWHN